MLSWGGPDCTWNGKGIVGMAQGSWSYAWISGDSWALQQVGLQERGGGWKRGRGSVGLQQGGLEDVAQLGTAAGGEGPRVVRPGGRWARRGDTGK